ncbi:hypothetical protein B0H14DRAFT_126292 [Mycena olivaceomarginata]|nr:hypothetical protein B0H14DRAFT_126292 [Mycena olivaceomarginata]
MLQSCTPPLPRLCWQHILYCPLQCQCACALRAVPHLPFATTPQSARLLAVPLHHTSASAARPTDPMLRQAQGYTVARPSAHPHPRTLHATRLCHRIPLRGMQGGVSAAILALAPHLLAAPRRRSTSADANRESSCSLASLGAAAFGSASG